MVQVKKVKWGVKRRGKERRRGEKGREGKGREGREGREKTFFSLFLNIGV